MVHCASECDDVCRFDDVECGGRDHSRPTADCLALHSHVVSARLRQFSTFGLRDPARVARDRRQADYARRLTSSSSWFSVVTTGSTGTGIFTMLNQRFVKTPDLYQNAPNVVYCVFLLKCNLS